MVGHDAARVRYGVAQNSYLDRQDRAATAIARSDKKSLLDIPASKKNGGTINEMDGKKNSTTSL